MRYGIPYKGSKNRIAKRIVELLPPAETLVDLFAGGCAVTHAALLSGKFGRVVTNDINQMPAGLFEDAASGKYCNEKRWIGREEFSALKDTDPYVRYCWSFGTNGKNYMYAKEIEPWKRALHYLMVLDDPGPMERMTGKRLQYPYMADVKANIGEYTELYRRWYAREVIGLGEEEINAVSERLEKEKDSTEEELRAYLCAALRQSGLTAAEVSERLGTFMGRHYFSKSQWEFPTYEAYVKMQAFMPLPRPYYECVRLLDFQSLQSLQSLESLHMDYREVEIPEEAVIYSDPPYRNVSGYDGKGFDHEAFYGWARAISRTHILFVSEYSMPEDFIKIRQFTVQKLMGKNNTGAVAVEGVYVHRDGLYFTEKTDLFGCLPN